MATFLWDFRGAKSKPQCLHFLKHLEETLERWGMDRGKAGMHAFEPGHDAVFLEVTDDEEDRLRVELKPNRIIDE